MMMLSCQWKKKKQYAEFIIIIINIIINVILYVKKIYLLNLFLLSTFDIYLFFMECMFLSLIKYILSVLCVMYNIFGIKVTPYIIIDTHRWHFRRASKIFRP